jgi:hypothetical protein
MRPWYSPPYREWACTCPHVLPLQHPAESGTNRWDVLTVRRVSGQKVSWMGGYPKQPLWKVLSGGPHMVLDHLRDILPSQGRLLSLEVVQGESTLHASTREVVWRGSKRWYSWFGPNLTFIPFCTYFQILGISWYGTL